MAFRDAMEVTKSPPMTWEDQVQEEYDTIIINDQFYQIGMFSKEQCL